MALICILALGDITHGRSGKMFVSPDDPLNQCLQLWYGKIEWIPYWSIIRDEEASTRLHRLKRHLNVCI